MKRKVRSVIIILLFFVTATLNYFYGGRIYSQVLGKANEYSIGKECLVSRPDCEKKYFQSYLDKIISLSNENRIYFSKIIIQNDQAGYSGNCPCPNDSDSAGHSCGGRSSYSKHGQISYCYDSDVSDSQISDLKDSLITQEKENLDNFVQKDINVFHEQYTFLLIVVIYGGIFLYFRTKTSL